MRADNPTHARGACCLDFPILAGEGPESQPRPQSRESARRGRAARAHVTARRRAERDPAAAAAAGAAGWPGAARAAWSPGSGARGPGPGPAAVPASRCTFSPGGGATCSSVRPNMATRSSRRESRLPFLFTLVALLPPGALCEVWTQRLQGGRAPLPQDRGFRVVQGDPRELRLWARGDARGASPAGEKPLRTRRSAALQPEPIKVYGQVSSFAALFLPALSSLCTSSPPHPSFAVASQVQALLGTSRLAFVFFPPHMSITVSR